MPIFYSTEQQVEKQLFEHLQSIADGTVKMVHMMKWKLVSNDVGIKDKEKFEQ